MNILHRRFHLIRGGNPGPARPEGVRPVKVPGWFYPVAVVIALAGVMVVLQPAEVLGFGESQCQRSSAACSVGPRRPMPR